MIGIAQDVGDACCRLDVSTSKGGTELHVVLMNLNRDPLQTSRWALEELNLRIKVTAADGSEPKRTAFGTAVLLPPQGSRLLDVVLKQKETLTTILDIRKQYTLGPGTYTVLVSRDVFIGKKKVELQKKVTIQIP